MFYIKGKRVSLFETLQILKASYKEYAYKLIFIGDVSVGKTKIFEYFEGVHTIMKFNFFFL